MRTNALTTVQVGTQVLTSTDTDAAPDGTTVELCDGLTVTESLGDQLWPMRPSVACTFTVFAPTVDDFTATTGDGVRVTYATPRTGGTDRLEVDVTVSDVSVRTTGLGVLFDITCVDRFTGAFTDQLVGDTPWSAEPVEDRVARIVESCGYMFDALGASYPGYDSQVAARDVDAQPALGLLTSLLDGWAVDFAAFYISQGVLSSAQLTANPALSLVGVRLFPTIDPATLVITEWTPSLTPSGIIAGINTLPGVLADPGDGYGVVIVTDNTSIPGESRADDTISTDYVDLGATFARRKGALVNTVAVSGFWGPSGAERTLTRSNGDPVPVLYQLSTELTDSDDAARVAAMYLPDAGITTDWLADAFSWRWYAEDTTDRAELPQVGDLVTVADIQDRHNPTGNPWYAGQLTGRVFKLTGAQPTLDLTIRPQLRRILGNSNALFTWVDLALSHPTVTWGDLNTYHTWNDYRLLRG